MGVVHRTPFVIARVTLGAQDFEWSSFVFDIRTHLLVTIAAFLSNPMAAVMALSSTSSSSASFHEAVGSSGASSICPGCEKEAVEGGNGVSEEAKNESIMRLSWALVHSRHPEDVQRGIAMLEASFNNLNSPLQKREKLYLLAVGHYRSEDYSRSRHLIERCLEIAPDWRQALTLKKVIEDKIGRDGVIGIGIAATAVRLVAGGIAAALVRRN